MTVSISDLPIPWNSRRYDRDRPERTEPCIAIPVSLIDELDDKQKAKFLLPFMDGPVLSAILAMHVLPSAPSSDLQWKYDIDIGYWPELHNKLRELLDPWLDDMVQEELKFLREHVEHNKDAERMLSSLAITRNIIAEKRKWIAEHPQTIDHHDAEALIAHEESELHTLEEIDKWMRERLTPWHQRVAEHEKKESAT